MYLEPIVLEEEELTLTTIPSTDFMATLMMRFGRERPDSSVVDEVLDENLRWSQKDHSAADEAMDVDNPEPSKSADVQGTERCPYYMGGRC